MIRFARSSMSRDPEKTVLVVDDEPQILSAIQRCLRREPYAVVAANDAGEALELLKECRVDVVIADERMPGITGTVLLSHVREHSPRASRVLLTGYPSEALVGNALEAGAEAFLYKPWDEQVLRTMVRDLLQAHSSAGTGGPHDQKWPSEGPFDLGGEGG